MKQHLKPCSKCPYRRDSAPGYLGSCSGDPERFLSGYLQNEKHPCHKMVDYDTDDNKVADNIEKSASCVGFAIM